MITDKLVQECIEFDKYEYGEFHTPEYIRDSLEKLEAKGCLVEHIMHCSSCPKFGKCCPI